MKKFVGIGQYKSSHEMNRAAFRARVQGSVDRVRHLGFTLPEIAIVVSVIAILGSMMLSKYSPDNTKATVLLTSMRTFADGMIRAKTSMGCFPSRPSALWRQADASAANSYCGIDSSDTWDGPYIDAQSVDTTTGNMMLRSVSGSTNIAAQREATPSGGLGWYYYAHASNVPNAVVQLTLQKCNGNKDTNATFENNTCRGTLGAGGSEMGTLDYKIEESY